MAISLPVNANEGVQTQGLFPLYVLLARIVSVASDSEVGIFHDPSLVYFLLGVPLLLFICGDFLLLVLSCSILLYIVFVEHVS